MCSGATQKIQKVCGKGHSTKHRTGQQLRGQVQIRLERSQTTMGRNGLRKARKLVEKDEFQIRPPAAQAEHMGQASRKLRAGIDASLASSEQSREHHRDPAPEFP